MRQSQVGAGISRGVAEGFSEEVTLGMKWRRMRRENVLGREQQLVSELGKNEPFQNRG